MPDLIKLIKPYICFDEVALTYKDIFESGIFTKGRYVHEFIDELKRYTGAGNAFLTTSATTALTMCLKLLEIGPGDEVIVSDFSFPASVNVIEDVGARPVFADVSLETYNMKPEELEKKITSRTRAVIFVDALGNPSGLLNIKKICENHGIPLIEDAACGIGSSINSKKLGSIADLTCFSFHPRKLLTTGEGGAITTDNAEYTKKLTVKLNHGSVPKDGIFDFVDYGYNYRLPDLQAVMGTVQIRKLDEIVTERRAIQTEFTKRLSKLGFVQQKTDYDVIHNIQSLVYLVSEKCDRDALCRYLKDNWIESTIGTYCLSNTTYFRKKYNEVQKNAKFLEENTITLPCYPSLDIDYICDIIGNYVNG